MSLTDASALYLGVARVVFVNSLPIGRSANHTDYRRCCHMSVRLLSFSLTALIAGALADKPGPNDWPQWRGQNRDGKSPESGLLQILA